MDNVISIIYFAIIAAALAGGFFNFKVLSKADKIVFLLLGLTFVGEGIAHYALFQFRNNLMVYALFNPLQLFVICWYFNESVKTLKTGNIGIWVGLVGILFAAFNLTYLQSNNSYNSNFLLFEGFCIISLCIIAFYSLLTKEETVIFKSVHFWVVTVLLCFWSFTYCIFGMYAVFQTELASKMRLLTYPLYVINLSFYTILATIFFHYPKMVPSGE